MSSELTKLTVVELRKRAKARGMTGYSSLRKDELVKRLSSSTTSPKRASSPSKSSSPKRKSSKECVGLKISEFKVRKVKGETKYYVKCAGAKRAHAVDKALFDKMKATGAGKPIPPRKPIDLLTGPGLATHSTSQPSKLAELMRERGLLPKRT